MHSRFTRAVPCRQTLAQAATHLASYLASCLLLQMGGVQAIQQMMKQMEGIK